MFDHEMGGYMATRYLIEQGHRRIACLVNARRSNTGRKRLAGYERALREVGLPIDARLEFESEYYIPSAYEASEAVLATDATAVFASSDNIALGLLKRLHEMGKSIPGDISVVSYDNSAADVLFEPALTAIEQDPGVLAEHALAACPSVLPVGAVGVPKRSFWSRRLSLRAACSSLLNTTKHVYQFMQIGCGVPVTDNAAGECQVSLLRAANQDNKTF